MSGKYRKHILVTRPLTEEQVSYAQVLGLEPLVVPALKVEFLLSSDKILKKIDRHPDTIWVFTSKNAVEALNRIQESEVRMRDIPEVYAVGEKTGEALSKLGIEAKIPQQQDASGLVVLIENHYKTDKPAVIHWCGNRTRPELKKGLKEAGFEFISLEVYETQLKEIKLPDEPIEAILFYSPSAVEAFRLSDGFKRELPELFAIGNTTGEALSLESGKHVYIPEEPATETLLKLVANILETDKNSRVPLRRGNKGG
jgi:uroporphyrinogen-III synthase